MFHLEELTAEKIAIALAALSFIIKMLVQYFKHDLPKETQERLDFVANQAVSAAEEMGRAGGWTGLQKLGFAKETVVGAFPAIESEELDVVIHSALAFMNLGNTGASTEKGTTAKPKAKK